MYKLQCPGCESNNIIRERKIIKKYQITGLDDNGSGIYDYIEEWEDSS